MAGVDVGDQGVSLEDVATGLMEMGTRWPCGHAWSKGQHPDRARCAAQGDRAVSSGSHRRTGSGRLLQRIRSRSPSPRASASRMRAKWASVAAALSTSGTRRVSRRYLQEYVSSITSRDMSSSRGWGNAPETERRSTRSSITCSLPMGHTDILLVTDAGCPIPSDAWVVRFWPSPRNYPDLVPVLEDLRQASSWPRRSSTRESPCPPTGSEAARSTGQAVRGICAHETVTHETMMGDIAGQAKGFVGTGGDPIRGETSRSLRARDSSRMVRDSRDRPRPGPTKSGLSGLKSSGQERERKQRDRSRASARR